MKYNANVASRQKWHCRQTVTTSYSIGTPALSWCTAYKSSGQFYRRMNHLGAPITWHFEKEEDAIMFALTWR